VEDAVLVTGEYVETGALLSLEHLGLLAQNAILPSLQMLAKWDRRGRLGAADIDDTVDVV